MSDTRTATFPERLKSTYKCKPRHLGKGQYGITFHANVLSRDAPDDWPAGSEVAIKFLDGVPRGYQKEQRSWPVWKELLELQHDGLVKMLDYHYKPKDCLGNEWFFAIAMEYCPGGNLLQLTERGMCWTQLVDYTGQILLALKYLHTRKDSPRAIHTDLKPANILLSGQHPSGMCTTIKIADFDDIVFFYQDVSERDTITSARGTPRYMAPEMLKKKDDRSEHAGRKSDVWSLGCIVYEMAFGAPHDMAAGIRGASTYVEQVQDHGMPGLVRREVKRCCEYLEHFLARCLNVDPDKRASVDDLLNMPLVSGPGSSSEGLPDVGGEQSVQKLLAGKLGDWTCLSCQNRAGDVSVNDSVVYDSPDAQSKLERSAVVLQRKVHHAYPERRTTFILKDLSCKQAAADMRLVADHVVLIDLLETSSATDFELYSSTVLPRVRALECRLSYPVAIQTIDFKPFPFLEKVDITLNGSQITETARCEIVIVSASVSSIRITTDGVANTVSTGTYPDFQRWNVPALKNLALTGSQKVALFGDFSSWGVGNLTHLTLTCKPRHADECNLADTRLLNLTCLIVERWSRVHVSLSIRESWPSLRQMILHDNKEVILENNVLCGIEKFWMSPVAPSPRPRIADIAQPLQTYWWLRNHLLFRTEMIFAETGALCATSDFSWKAQCTPTCSAPCAKYNAGNAFWKHDYVDDLCYTIKSMDGLAEGPRGVRKGLKSLDPVGCYNFAVVGNSGVGKSSLINALRGMRPNEPLGAKVGVGETTTECIGYGHPDAYYIELWDIPGASEKTCKPQDYFEHYSLYCFDEIILVSGERLLEMDVKVIRSAAASNIPCLWVRSKSDVAVSIADEELSEEDEATGVDGLYSVIADKLHPRRESIIRSRIRDVLVHQRSTLMKHTGYEMEFHHVCNSKIFEIKRPDSKRKLPKFVLSFDEQKLLDTLAQHAEVGMEEKKRLWNTLTGPYEERAKQFRLKNVRRHIFCQRPPTEPRFYM